MTGAVNEVEGALTAERGEADAVNPRDFPEPVLVDNYVPGMLLDMRRSPVINRVAKGFVIVSSTISDAVGSVGVSVDCLGPTLRHVARQTTVRHFRSRAKLCQTGPPRV